MPTYHFSTTEVLDETMYVESIPPGTHFAVVDAATLAPLPDVINGQPYTSDSASILVVVPHGHLGPIYPNG